MLVGLVTEIKPGERRCALTPAGARELTAAGQPANGRALCARCNLAKGTRPA